MSQWQVEAREAIRDLVARYNANGDAGRLDELTALFAPDAILELPGRRCCGLNEIRAMFEEAVARTGADASPARFVRHFTSTLQIDLEGPDSARSRCYYLVLSDRGLDHQGRYVDRYARRDGDWRFVHRQVTVDACAPGGWGEQGLAGARGDGRLA